MAKRAAGGRGEVILFVEQPNLGIVPSEPFRWIEIFTVDGDIEFSLGDLDRLGAEAQKDVIKVIACMHQQTLSINCSAGTGYRDD